MHMVAWWREYFLFAVELGDLLHQHLGIAPAGAIGLRNPARAQVAEAVHQELHVRGQGTRPSRSGLLKVRRNRA